MNPRAPWFVAGFLAGGAMGAAGALLVTPAKGDELIATLKAHWRQAREDARRAGQQAEADVLTRYRAIRDASGFAETGATSGVYVAPRQVGAPANVPAAVVPPAVVPPAVVPPSGAQGPERP
jgi:hypothetical protein